jgi:peptidoglycan LD-endopeptidase CwlK
MHVDMARTVYVLCLGLLIVALFGFGPDDEAWGKPGGSPRRPAEVSASPLDGPAGVYARVPARDEYGRDQLAMFRAWNPDPVGNHEANLRALNPALAKVVRRAQADNPNLRFVVGSGRRDAKLQRMALAWGWSRTRDSPHRTGDAVDLWPLDREGHVDFDPQSQNRIATAMRKSAAELGVAIRWGGHFHGYKHMDRSHFELVPP